MAAIHSTLREQAEAGPVGQSGAAAIKLGEYSGPDFLGAQRGRHEGFSQLVRQQRDSACGRR